MSLYILATRVAASALHTPETFEHLEREVMEARLRAAETRAKDTRRGGARSLTALVESARQFRSALREKPAPRQRAQ